MTARLVVADDDDALRQLLGLLIRRDGRFEIVAEARDGQEALDAVAAHDPDLLLLDLAMPRMDGFAVLQALAASARPRVAVLTGFSDPTLHERAIQAGAAGCLEKGRDFSRLLDQLDMMLDRLGPPNSH